MRSDYGDTMSPRAAQCRTAMTGVLLRMPAGRLWQQRGLRGGGDCRTTAGGHGQERREAACALLSPHTRAELEQSTDRPRAQAILEEDIGEGGTVRDAHVFDTMAQVRFDDETVFLSRFDSGLARRRHRLHASAGAALRLLGQRGVTCAPPHVHRLSRHDLPRARPDARHRAEASPVRQFVRENSLSLAFGLLFSAPCSANPSPAGSSSTTPSSRSTWTH